MLRQEAEHKLEIDEVNEHFIIYLNEELEKERNRQEVIKAEELSEQEKILNKKYQNLLQEKIKAVQSSYEVIENFLRNFYVLMKNQ